MRTLVVYDDADSSAVSAARLIGDGFIGLGDVDVVPASAGLVDIDVSATNIVVGGGMTDSGEVREGRSLEEWFSKLGKDVAGIPVAGYETRLATQQACRTSDGVNRQFELHHFHVVAPADSFIVDESGALVDDELKRARRWAAVVASGFASVARKRSSQLDR